ncbi:hypothetical protein B0H10DRAFT_1869341 [Mycena sp. CBHHK59/15]|nr:hypothetical protein B0H10DRAFT_1869341 [Mycena sp. CBHHK59/15]
MDEIIPGLWVGDLPSATDTKNLKANGIFSILSAMRGRVTINETFIRHQILLDDTEEADILIHFMPSITFIQAELDKGRGVLVHCQAGMSRSVTIVAAYLMYTQNIDPQAALDIIKKSRPHVEPNAGFLLQLEIFHKAAFKISRRDKTTRMFYMEKAVEEVMSEYACVYPVSIIISFTDGDGSLPETDMFAKYPRTPTDSAPATPGGPRRRIRCKMCRQELATREHMLDHGQLGAPTPAANTPVGSRQPSMSQITRPRMGSISRPRRPSMLAEQMSMSALDTDDAPEDEQSGEATARPGAATVRRTSSDPARRPRLRALVSGIADTLSMSALSMSALETEDDSGEDEAPPAAATNGTADPPPPLPSTHAFAAATRLGRRLSDAVIASPAEISPQESGAPDPGLDAASAEVATTHFSSSEDIASQLFAHPKLAAFRTPMMTPLTSLQGAQKAVSPPILVNPKCSGYFVEPVRFLLALLLASADSSSFSLLLCFGVQMKWMEPFLESGQIAGKIVCPNRKCGAKLGNYDWAGMRCGCKEWVTPGFCINRSKVDEVI